MPHLFEYCSWYRGVNTYQVILESLRFDTHLPKHQQQVQCEVLPQSGAGWRGRSAVFQATRNHYVSSRVNNREFIYQLWLDLPGYFSSSQMKTWLFVLQSRKINMHICSRRTCTFLDEEAAFLARARSGLCSWVKQTHNDGWKQNVYCREFSPGARPSLHMLGWFGMWQCTAYY